LLSAKYKQRGRSVVYGKFREAEWSIRKLSNNAPEGWRNTSNQNWGWKQETDISGR